MLARSFKTERLGGQIQAQERDGRGRVRNTVVAAETEVEALALLLEEYARQLRAGEIRLDELAQVNQTERGFNHGVSDFNNGEDFDPCYGNSPEYRSGYTDGWEAAENA